MKRMMIVLFLISLLNISNVIAQKAVSEPEAKDGSALSIQSLVKSDAGNNLLFFKVPPHRSIKGPQKFEFRFRVNNLPHMVEQITVGKREARSGSVIEVFSKYPLRRKNLYLLARSETHQARVVVLINGQVVQDVSLAEFLAHNQKLKADGNFMPVAGSSNVFVIRPLKVEGDFSLAGYVPDPSCTGGCYDQYANCAEMDCGSPYVECDSCYPQLNACINDCPLICIPDGTYQDRGDEMFCDDHSPECVNNRLEFIRTCYYRLYTLHRITYCDGSVEEEELNVHYENISNRMYTTVWCN